MPNENFFEPTHGVKSDENINIYTKEKDLEGDPISAANKLQEEFDNEFREAFSPKENTENRDN